MGIIQEIQEDLLKDSVKLSDILIKAKIPATKLDLLEFKNWLDKEIQGYANGDSHPQYRRIKGICKYYDAFYGWQNMQFSSSQAETDLSFILYSKSIFEIEDLLATTLVMEYQTLVSANLFQQYNLNRFVNVAIFFPRRSLSNILNGVRGKLMEYIAKLDDEGIEGNNSNFTKDEKEKVKTMVINQTFNVSGGNFMNQTASENSSQIQNNGLDIKQVKELYELISDNINKLGLNEEKYSLLDAELQTLRIELEKEPNNSSLIQRSLQSIKNILENAAGSAIGQGFIYSLKLLLG